MSKKKKDAMTEDVVVPQVPEEISEESPALLEEEVVTADKSKLQQTVSHISADSALLDRQAVGFDVESERKKQRVSNIIRNIFVYTFLTI